MTIIILEFLDRFFLLFHSALVVFNLVGWLPRRIRRLHLISIVLTLLSWVGLGYWYGWGYCLCTDWHWQVLRHLGRPAGTRSYIQYLIEQMTGLSPPVELTIMATQWVFIVLLLVTIVVNLRDALHRLRHQ
ncbi:DUF2784 domain-containing protein [Spirochaeta africana]|uniref:DUF2784 domain-containing protein n=1 Tax=Spirochaeta africana (strain ATCC 700263 / DSM 8902 / Z-7692) TaxID=889378 RepID=H9ULM9_SPIAZ|nr:DUF2784 domain-containing protein [Spirochaeta africana]AFG38422.1 Protein of Unknown function (DUF2784) [Spirochaeta africana DSM 8902]